ncbi:hypothetical protein L3X38_038231 [Prunus dulcis]|uniref:Uncharacterized protein n=1 Tax=Prunus dulcis TaxID=3755 RepID=A0AAD4V5Z4_PRUDU|nr:hypothetical protein L3X38_038231 [Prunus dulcis]
MGTPIPSRPYTVRDFASSGILIPDTHLDPKSPPVRVGDPTGTRPYEDLPSLLHTNRSRGGSHLSGTKLLPMKWTDCSRQDSFEKYGVRPGSRMSW